MIRNQGFIFLGILSTLIIFPSILVANSKATPTPKPTPRPSISPLPSSVPSPNPSPSILPLASGVDPKSLLKEFARAQSLELKALEHRNKYEWKELKAAQEAHQKEWDKTEKEARHQFMENHQKGPERRTYIQDFIKRRDVMRKRLADERVQKAHEQEAHLNRLKKEQTSNLESFKQYLDKKLMPPTDLWPKSGG